MSEANVLEIDGLTVRVATPLGERTLVDAVSLQVGSGERVALVGESGSGKSMTAKAVLRLERSVRLSGSIRLAGTEVVTATARRMRALRGAAAAMVFQDPMTALNPVLPIGYQVAEPLLLRGMGRRQAMQQAVAMLDRLGVPDAARRARAYPSEFSGGMRQRVVIATALVTRPRLLIADEPTTALDVRVQQQVLDLLEEQTAELGAGLLLITHDLGIVAGLAHRVVVMCSGRVVEAGGVDQVFARPSAAYTRGLIASVPRLDSDPDRRLLTVDDVIRQEAAPHAGGDA